MASSTSSFLNAEIPMGQSTVVITKIIGNSDREVKIYKGSYNSQDVAIKAWPNSNYAHHAENEFNSLKACQTSPYVLKIFAYQCHLPYPGLYSCFSDGTHGYFFRGFIRTRELNGIDTFASFFAHRSSLTRYTCSRHYS